MDPINDSNAVIKAKHLYKSCTNEGKNSTSLNSRQVLAALSILLLRYSEKVFWAFGRKMFVGLQDVVLA